VGSAADLAAGSAVDFADPRDRIAALAGPYSLPDGEVPLVDGVPRWPWEADVARQRLERVAARLGLRLSGGESLLEGASNDAWLIGDMVLRVCWRGDIDRLLREVSLARALPEAVHCPQPLDYGRDETLSWTLTARVVGTPLAQIWGIASEPQLRGCVQQLAEMLAALHAWTPPREITDMLTLAAPGDADNALGITGKSVVPLALTHQLRLVEYIKTMPFVDGGLMDDAAAWLAEAHAGSSIPTSPRVFLHGDVTPGNVLVRDGRVVGLLDYEWAWFGPRDAELALPLFWRYSQDPDSRADRYVTWLAAEYPALADLPDAAERQRLYRAAFALRGAVHWPPDGPEADLEPYHPILLLRRLLAAAGSGPGPGPGSGPGPSSQGT
jgi:aminoglycoside phosphotransferase (APT) family kinase protein